MWFWSNLPDTISAGQMPIYRRRWSIEGMVQRLESVLDSEIESLGSPRVALLGFASVLLAYNVLAVLKRSVSRLIARRSQRDGRHRLFTWQGKCAAVMRACRSHGLGLPITSNDLRKSGRASVGAGQEYQTQTGCQKHTRPQNRQAQGMAGGKGCACSCVDGSGA